MYLVHIHLRPLAAGESLPDDTATVMMSAGLEVGLEHAVAHLASTPRPVIGVYVRAATLDEAESLAEDIWWRASGTDRRLGRWVPLRVEVPLMPEPPWSK
ncbi:hypothetical protein GCM10022403_087890 [Streptomyces coacervatus]|uniref:YCII-related domain-containing protein n=1 Tax=Streptomyces coacervatus TaxID=647381 RepID=A0ABP7JEY5_9ACTN|nr:hypothetical protein [Streptomyces coacervatus]MDF2273413.1 hypothetical protein [Streptomyces coacervatus]